MNKKNINLSKEEKLLLKNKRKKAISNMNLIEKLLIYLWVSKIWFEYQNHNKNKKFFWKCTKVNPFNPLTWILIIVSFPIEIIKTIIRLFKEIGGMFKVQKY